MKVLKILLIIIVILAAIVAVLHLAAPKEFHVERAISIEAPLPLIHDQVKSLENRQEWSPWAELDPDMSNTFEGTDGEVGSVHKWEGNKNVGKGMQEITSITDNRVESKLTFIEPFAGISHGFIQLDQGKDNVDVTWGFDSENGFPFTIMTYFMDMDTEIGKDFERGLAYLKTHCEQLADEASASNNAYEIIETQWLAKSFIVKRDEVPFNEIGQYFQTSMPALHQAIGIAGIEITGAPCGLYYSWDEDNQVTDMAVAIPATSGAKAPDGFEATAVEESRALMLAYYGAYDKVEDAHYAIHDYMQANGDTLSGLVIEEYATDPGLEPDTSKWLTNIYYLIK